MAAPESSRTFWNGIIVQRLHHLGVPLTAGGLVSDQFHRQILEAEIIALSAALSSVKEQLNMFTSISLICPEILGHIFSFAALNAIPGQGRTEDDWDKPFSTLENVHNILGWVTATHVCRRWRAVALSLPRLWTIVDPARLSVTGMRDILDHSHQLPLTPRISVGLYSGGLASAQVLFEPQYLTRIHSLHIEASNVPDLWNPEREEDLLTGHVDNVIQLLHRADKDQHLDIRSLVFRFVDTNGDETNDFELPDITAPRLRHLRLFNVHPQWHSLTTYRHLTYFEMTYDDLPYDFVERTPLFELIEFLQGSPRLQVLRLVRSLPEYYPDMVDFGMSAEDIHLPRLKELHLEGLACDCELLARCFIVPETCSVKIVAKDSHKRYQALDDILAKFDTICSTGLDICSDKSQSSMEFTFREEPLTFLSSDVGEIEDADEPCSDSEDECGTGNGTRRLQITLLDFPQELDWPNTPPNSRENSFWECFFRHLPADIIDNISVRVDDDDKNWKPSRWLKLFESATMGEQVHVEGSVAIENLIGTLESSSSRLWTSRFGSPIFPRMEMLSLGLKSHQNPSAVIASLKGCLQARRKCGLEGPTNVELDVSDEIGAIEFGDITGALKGLTATRRKL